MNKVAAKPVQKIIPSRMETALQQWLYAHIGPHLPARMTPNQLTLIGAIGALCSILCTLLTNCSRWFFCGTILGACVHLIADDLDGYVARTRHLGSNAGAYFDLITDVLYSTFLMVALGFTPYAHLELTVFAVPLYGVINITAMNNILYRREFLFPRIGPIESHLMYAVIAGLSMAFGERVFCHALGLDWHAADFVVAIGLIPSYYEMIRLQIRLFRNLKKEQQP